MDDKLKDDKPNNDKQNAKNLTGDQLIADAANENK